MFEFDEQTESDLSPAFEHGQRLTPYSSDPLQPDYRVYLGDGVWVTHTTDVLEIAAGRLGKHASVQAWEIEICDREAERTSGTYRTYERRERKMFDFKNPVHRAAYKGYVISIYVVWGQDGTFYGEVENSNTGHTRATPKLFNKVEETVSASKELVDSMIERSK